MTWVDIIVLGVLAISALLAFMRGFVREVLGIGSWIGAVIVSIWGFPYARPRFEQWFAGSPDLVNPATFGALFIGSLIVLMFVSHWIGAIVRGSVLGEHQKTSSMPTQMLLAMEIQKVRLNGSRVSVELRVPVPDAEPKVAMRIIDFMENGPTVRTVANPFL